jgi:Xaa-Pro aminopeptidase
MVGLEDWGELGPAMRALPNERWRNFVRYLVADTKHGAITRAARKAGWGRPNTKAQTLSKQAWALSRDERIIAAVAEESRKVLRVAHPEIVNALLSVVRDKDNKDRVRAITAALDRLDPVQTKHNIEVMHRHVDGDQEALEEYRAARELGATEDKLRSLFGGNSLAKLQRLDAEDNARRAEKAKLIEHSENAA